MKVKAKMKAKTPSTPISMILVPFATAYAVAFFIHKIP
jgi:hypothetical protein